LFLSQGLTGNVNHMAQAFHSVQYYPPLPEEWRNRNARFCANAYSGLTGGKNLKFLSWSWTLLGAVLLSAAMSLLHIVGPKRKENNSGIGLLE
jgi:hypothetical protein